MEGYVEKVVWTVHFMRAHPFSVGHLFQRGWWGLHVGPVMVIVTRSRRRMRAR